MVPDFSLDVVFAVAAGVTGALARSLCIVGLSGLQPMLESIDALCVWAQKSDVFICDFIAALEVCEGQLYTFYVDHTTSYGRDDFWALSALLECSHELIQLKWICDLNETSEAHLAFMVAGEQHFAMHGGEHVSRATFSEVVATVKRECAGKSLGLEFYFFSNFEVLYPAFIVLHGSGLMLILVCSCSVGVDSGVEILLPEA
jgi:hypothetical protein